MANVLYQEDLAYIHDAGFGGHSRGAAPELLKILRRAGIRRGTLVDLGCGSGIWARTAQAAGFDVVGVDSSAAMLRLATRASPGSHFHCESLYNFEFPACVAVTVIGEPLNYLQPGERSGPPLSVLFNRIYRALQPGGLLLFDVIVCEGPSMTRRLWNAGDDWAVLTDISELSRERILLREMITFRKRGASWRRSEETHKARLFREADIAAALRKAGFGVRMSRAYGRFALLPRRRAFICQKPT